MPIISIFFGIIIRINFRDHNLPRRIVRHVQRWMALHREALARNWELAYSGEPTIRIPGLDQE